TLGGVKDREPLQTHDFPQIAGKVVEAMFGLAAQGGTQGTVVPATITVVNGTRLVIETNAAGHAEIAELLASLRRFSDVAVIVQARLHEVDDAFYQKLRKVQRIHWEEVERQFLEGKAAPGDDLFKLLDKQ